LVKAVDQAIQGVEKNTKSAIEKVMNQIQKEYEKSQPRRNI